MGAPNVIGSDSSEYNKILQESAQRARNAEEEARSRARSEELMRMERDRLERERIAADEAAKIAKTREAEQAAIDESLAQDNNPNKIDFDFYKSIFQGVESTEPKPT